MTTFSPHIPAHSPRLLTVDNPVLRVVFAMILMLGGLVIAYIAIQEKVIFSTRIGLIVGYLVGIPILLSANYDRSIMLMFGFASVAGLLKYKTDFNPVVHVTIDIMMAVICLGWFLRRFFAYRYEGSGNSTPLNGLILFFIFVCLIQVFHPLSYSVYSSFAALKMHISMIPLYYFGYHYLRSIQQIRNWIIVFILIGAMLSIVTVYQFRRGPDQMKLEMPEYAYMIDVNTWQDETGRSYFRPMSTTANPGGASTWIQCVIPLSVALLLGDVLSKRWKTFVIASLMLLIIGLSLSLIRQMFMVTVLAVAFMFLIQLRTLNILRKISFFCFFCFVAIGGFSVAERMAGSSGSAVTGLFSLLSEPIDSFAENRGHFLTVTYQVAQLYPLGAGLGRTGPAVAKFREDIEQFYRTYGGPTSLPSENYFLVMISETGVLGCLAIVLITFMILWKGFQSYRRFQDNNLKWLAAGCLAVIFSIFVVYFGGPALVTPPLNMFFWFLGGVLMKLPVLDAQIQAEAEVADP